MASARRISPTGPRKARPDDRLRRNPPHPHIASSLQWRVTHSVANLSPMPLQRYGLSRFARNHEHASPPATNQPDGQITKSLSSPSRKNISLNPSGKSLL